MQVEESGITINDHPVHVLGFADDLNILSESLEGALVLTAILKRAATKVSIRIKVE